MRISRTPRNNLQRAALVASAAVLLMLGLSTMVPTLSAAQLAETCDGATVTVNLGLGELTTDGPDVVMGTSGDDLIAAGDGDDIICGGGGDDSIWGQAGNDIILGGDGDDRIRGGAGNDLLAGDAGSDNLAGGPGNDIVRGGDGPDARVSGGTGDDHVDGNDGDDALVSGNGGEDVVDGGNGDDKVIGGPRPDSLFGGPGNDLLRGLKGADVISGGAGDDELFGGHQPDELDGGDGTDMCNGGTTGDGAAEADSATNCESGTQVEELITDEPVGEVSPPVLAIGDEASGGDGRPVEGGGDVIEPGPIPAPTSTPGPAPQSGLLTAADIDDNLNFGQFLNYLQAYQAQSTIVAPIPEAEDFVDVPPVTMQAVPTLEDRVVITLTDTAGAPLSNATIAVQTQAATIAEVTASAAGVAYLFPGYINLGVPTSLELTITDGSGASATVTITPSDIGPDGSITVAVPGLTGQLPSQLDVAFVIDTTGSMGDELEYLKAEFASIVQGVTAAYPNVDMRYALVVYRDIGDAYITRTFDFATAAEMLTNLDRQSASGGGDYPEAMEAALAEANGLSWRTGNVSRVAFLNADAPPHAENTIAALREADSLRQLGVRIYPLAASGVGDSAEYLMRVMAVTTGGRHLFLTDDSGVGGSHQEPRVACFVVTRLDQLLERVLVTELAGERIEPDAQDIIRTVGDYDNGVCGDVPPPEPGEVIATANLGADPFAFPRSVSFEYAVLESYPEQIVVTFSGPPLACMGAQASATGFADVVVLEVLVGGPISDEPIVCPAIIVEHQLTLQLSEGLDGRSIVNAGPAS